MPRPIPRPGRSGIPSPGVLVQACREHHAAHWSSPTPVSPRFLKVSGNESGALDRCSAPRGGQGKDARRAVRLSDKDQRGWTISCMNQLPEEPAVIDKWLAAPVTGRQTVVNWTSQETLGQLASGFQHAAEQLVHAWPDDQYDGVLPPIMYLYRHAIELALKATITSATQFLGEIGQLPEDGVPLAELPGWLRGRRNSKGAQYRPAPNPGHDLSELRSYLVHLLKQDSLFPQLDSDLENTDRTGRLLEELHQLDPDGSGLRYPARWDPAAGANISTSRPGVKRNKRGVSEVGSGSVLLDIDRMSEDLGALLARILAIDDTITEERLGPLTWSREGL